MSIFTDLLRSRGRRNSAHDIERAAGRINHLEYHIDEIVGCLSEYQAMPTKCLMRRLQDSIKRAQVVRNSEDF